MQNLIEKNNNNKIYFCLIINIMFYHILSYHISFLFLSRFHYIPSYVLLLHAIIPFLSDISKQGSLSVCLFIAVRNLQLTFLCVNLKGLKCQRCCIYVLSRLLVISTLTVSNMNYECFMHFNIY